MLTRAPRYVCVSGVQRHLQQPNVNLVKEHFPEAVIFEMNWSGTAQVAISSLITWCKANKKIRQLVQCG